MKKFGFSIILSLILVVVFVIVSVGSISAAPTPKSWITITHLAEDEITFDWGWNNVGVYSYSIYVVESTVRYYFYHEDLGVRTISNEGTVDLTHTGIDTGDNNIYVRLWMWGKNGKMIKNVRLDLRVEVPSST